MNYKLKRTGRSLIYSGSALEFYKDTMRLPSGRIEEWEFVHHKRGGGACIVPVLPDGRILLVRQYRPCVERETLELPAGSKEDPAENAEAAALRELEEETGFSCDRLTFIARLKTTMSWCDETTDVFAAENVSVTKKADPDDAEEISLCFFTLDELKQMIYKGILQDAKTVAGIMAYAGYKDK